MKPGLEKFCEAWARGKIKTPIAKQAILDSHAVAKKNHFCIFFLQAF